MAYLWLSWCSCHQLQQIIWQSWPLTIYAAVLEMTLFNILKREWQCVGIADAVGAPPGSPTIPCHFYATAPPCAFTPNTISCICLLENGTWAARAGFAWDHREQEVTEGLTSHPVSRATLRCDPDPWTPGGLSWSYPTWGSAGYQVFAQPFWPYFPTPGLNFPGITF